MKNALLITLALLALLSLPQFFRSPPGADATNTTTPMPWQIDTLADGNTRVFGLTLAHSTLADARTAFAAAPAIAIVGRRDEPGSLEAFFDGVRLGPLTGRIVLTLHVDSTTLTAMRARAVKTEHMDSAMLRSTLADADQALVERLPIAAIVFVPGARLDEATLVERFGAPTERLVRDDVTHLLYPSFGLDIARDARGRVQLQYVAPARFDALRAPLRAGWRPPQQIARSPSCAARSS